MVELHAGLRLAGPASIQPDTPTEFVLEYANHDADHRHRLQTVTTAPTWNLANEETHDVDQVISAKSRKPLRITIYPTPKALGGHHGLDVMFTATSLAGDRQPTQRKVAEPLTRPVAGVQQFQAVVSPPPDGELPPAVRRLLQQWGFDIYVAEDVETVTQRFTKFDDSPIIFAGVVPQGAGEAGRQRVSSGAWAADDHAKLSFLLTEEDIKLPELPGATAVFRADLTDQRAMLQETGPELLTERRGLQTGESARLRKILKQESTEVLRAVAYGTLLNAAGVTPENVLETIDTPENFLSTGQTASSRPHPPWPMRGAGPQNTGHHPAQEGPTTAIISQWQYETDGQVRSSPAVVDGTVYVASDDNSVYALDAGTGRVRWQYETDGGVWSSPAVVDGTVYVGSRDNSVYALTGR
jgi:hypothetical protein